MRHITELFDFLHNGMSMTDIYQPAVILHLLEQDGTSTKVELSRTLSGYDEEIQEYYEKILMRWPKITLTKHKIVSYDRRNALFSLNFDLEDKVLTEQAKQLCEQKIREWIEKKSLRRSIPKAEASTRFRVLKAARGKCELCGISSKISPIDIDHIFPRNQADRYGYVLNGNIKMHIDDERNLQALCYRCNRAKRDQDTTDFRQPRSKIIREHALAYTTSNDQQLITRKIAGDELLEKLFEKLIDEHARLIDKDAQEPIVERITDMIEALVAIAKTEGFAEEDILALVRQRRDILGGFDAGMYLVDGAA
ncbi:MAG: HNH endonuclease [Roseiflexaceae bacterium]|nr:HNH endonuclease [Roseiflexaceae bacterium]